jgi:hypothetical protein
MNGGHGMNNRDIFTAALGKLTVEKRRARFRAPGAVISASSGRSWRDIFATGKLAQTDLMPGECSDYCISDMRFCQPAYSLGRARQISFRNDKAPLHKAAAFAWMASEQLVRR